MRKWVGILPVALAIWAAPATGAMAASASVQMPPDYPCSECANPDDKLLKKTTKP